MAANTIDPVAAANEYREALLTALGDRDPAAVQAATPVELRRLIADAGDDLRTRPEAGEWSVLELVGHFSDAELVLSTRYRFILAEDTPPIQAYDQDLWATRMRHNDASPEDLLDPFEAVRRSNVALWQASSPEDHARYGIHAERGPESYELTFWLAAGHDLFHLDQARQTLAAVRAR